MAEDERDLRVQVDGAQRRLTRAGVAAPRPDALALAAHVLGCDVGEVVRRIVLREAVDAAFVERYATLVAERAERIPLQHLTGAAHFRRLTLAVGPGVFVPRPETELTAGLVIEELARLLETPPVWPDEGPVVADLCTGSGAIALAVKDEVPRARVHAVELSAEAHAWAARNVELLGLEVDLRLGDATTAFDDLAGGVDVVVSNPPYIPPGMAPVDPEVRDHDPGVALYGTGEDGLGIPRLVAARAAWLLRPGGLLVMEHADSQGESLPAALVDAGVWRDVEDRWDLTGRPRVTLARRRAPA